MAKTKMDAGLCIAAYVDDGMGRRLVIAPKTDGFNTTVIVATTQAEAKAAIGALRQLAEELPP